MAKILAFPGPGVRAEIHTMINLYAAGKWGRQKMMTAVAGRLDEYGIKSLAIKNYHVRKAEAILTVLGIWPVVIIEAKNTVTDPCCPTCKSATVGYLAGDKTVTVMCRGCGCIFQFKNEEAYASEKS